MWVSLKLALHKLSCADCTWAHKFLHDWLPLRGAKHSITPTASPLCPQCKQEDKTIWHFFECQHNKCEQQFWALREALNAHHIKNHIDPHMFQLLWQGLQAIRQDTPLIDQPEYYPEPYHKLFYAQQSIGWDQLYYGRISTLWAHCITIDSQYRLSGDVFYSQVIGLIWKCIFECWTQCNQHLHSPTAKPPDYAVLAEQVCHIIEAASQNPALAAVAPTRTAEQILQWPLPFIHGWAQCGAQHIQNYLTAAHKCAVLHTQDIRKFFQPKQNPDLQTPQPTSIISLCESFGLLW